MDYPELDYFLNESLSDVLFVVDGHRLPAIKHILSLKSRVFRDMFSENYESEGTEESKLPEIVVKNTTFDALKTLIRFLYSNELVFNEENDWTHISDVYQLADRYDLLRLRQRVVQHLEDRLKVKYIKELVSIATIVFNHKIDDLMPKVMSFLMKNIHQLKRNSKKELKALEVSTNGKLLDAMTTECMKCEQRIHLTYRKSHKEYKIDIKDTSFVVLKAFIRFFYFGEMSLKNEDDFQLFRKVCDMCNTYDNKDLMEVISDHLCDLKNISNIKEYNLQLISRIASDYKMAELLRIVNLLKDLLRINK